MKVWMGVCQYYGPSIWSVAEKYREFSPEEEIEWVGDWVDADVCVDHTIGTPDRFNLVHPLERKFSEDVKARLEMAKAGVTKVAYVHHCSILADQFYHDTMMYGLSCTGFLDAPSIMVGDLAKCEGFTGSGIPTDHWRNKWLRVAWGVDPSEFLLPERKTEPEYLIYTWGASHNPEVEYIQTIYEAVKEVGGRMLHSGRDYAFDQGQHYVYLPPADSKEQVALRYNSCWFANAMRNEDGFELANVEAPLSNCRPISLATPAFKYHFEEYGVTLFADPTNLKDDLVKIFQQRKEPVTRADKRVILERFNWRDTVTPFWERVMANAS